MKIISFITLMTISIATNAGWTLWNQASDLNFVSTVNSNTSEVHSFTNMDGTISDNGEATLKIDLASVETNNVHRNEQISKLIFDIENFHELLISIKLDKNQFASLAISSPVAMAVNTTISLHGISKKIRANLLVTRLQTGCLLINSLQPMIISLADFDLLDNLEKLRSIAKLKSISNTVPVTLNLFYLKDMEGN